MKAFNHIHLSYPFYSENGCIFFPGVFGKYLCKMTLCSDIERQVDLAFYGDRFDLDYKTSSRNSVNFVQEIMSIVALKRCHNNRLFSDQSIRQSNLCWLQRQILLCFSY